MLENLSFKLEKDAKSNYYYSSRDAEICGRNFSLFELLSGSLNPEVVLCHYGSMELGYAIGQAGIGK